MSKSRLLLATMAFCLALVAEGVLFAQAPTGTILGTVRDPSGAVVPNAQVTITNQNTNFKRSGSTNESGDYQFNLVDPAPYTLTVEVSGFKKYVQPNVPLTARQILRVDVTVQVGAATDIVTVTAEVTPVNSESMAITESYAPTGLKNSPMPLPMDLVPVERIGNLSLQSVGVGGSNYKIDGARINQMRLVRDGRTAIYYTDVPLSSTEEIKMISRNANAEFATPATVTTTTRGGGNAFHAHLDTTLYHPALGSLGPNFINRPGTHGSWKAAAVGSGPVIIPKIYNGTDRTWFFVDYDRAASASGTWAPILNLPTAAMRSGDFSNYRAASGAVIPIIDPLTGTQFPGNIIPADRVNAVSAKIRELYPLPNQGDPNSTYQNYSVTFNYYGSALHARFWRFDQKLSNKDTLNYSHNLYSQVTWFDVAASGFSKLPQLYNAETSVWTFSHAFAETHVFSPTVVNEARFAFDRYLQPTGQNVKGQNILTDWGITGIDPSLDYTGVPNVTFGTLSGVGQVYNPAIWREHRFSYLDNLTWQKGKHTIKTGANYTRFNGRSEGATGNPFGAYAFSGRMTNGGLAVGGSDWADFLLGYPDNTTRFTPRVTTLPFNSMFGAYIQDDWKITPRLTMNIGVRYDLEPSPVDEAGLYYSFNPETGALVFPTQYAMDHVSPLFNPLIPLELASEAGLPAKLIPVDKNNFAPRLGFAFRPFNNAQTVVRAAYGIYTNGKLGSAWNRGPAGSMLNSGGPFALSETFINTQPLGGTVGPPTLAFPSPFLASAGGNTAASYGVGFTTPDYHDAYAQQWNVTFEQEALSTAFRFSYVGNKSTNLLWGRNINQMPASTIPFNISGCGDFTTARPNPLCRRNYKGFTSVSMTDGGGNSSYHAAQFEFTRPFSKGFQAHGGYMWAKELTDVEESSYLGVQGIDPYNRAYNKGPSNYIPSQRFMFDFVWQLPVGRGQHFLSSAPGVVNQIVGGWQISWYANYSSGTPFSIIYTGRDLTGTGNTSGRADRIASGRVSNPSQNNYFDPSAFEVPACGPADPNYPTVTCMPIGRFGNSGRNILYAPPASTLYSFTEQLAIMKTFPLYKEKLKFTASVYTINPFNRAYLLPPNQNISDPNVGKQSKYGGIAPALYGVGQAARSVILGGRLEF